MDGKISCPLFSTIGESPLLTTLAGYLLVAKDPAPGLLLLPPGTAATITRVLTGASDLYHYYAATVGSITYRILLNWARSSNQTGYLMANNSTSPSPTVLGLQALTSRRLRPAKQRAPRKSSRADLRVEGKTRNDTEATIRDEYVIGNKPEVIIHHLPVAHKEL